MAERTESKNPVPMTPTAEREPRMIARVLAGEHEVFHDLIRPYERGIYFAAFSILQSAADAEEVAQETVFKAFKNLRSFRGESKFGTWLVTIAVNEARCRLRHARVLAMDSIDETLADEEGEPTPAVITDWREIPLESLERKELRQLLQNAISSLPEKYREVLVLRDVREMHIAETAVALGISEALVKTRLLRARLAMQKLLAPQLQSKRSGLFGLFRKKPGGSWF